MEANIGVKENNLSCWTSWCALNAELDDPKCLYDMSNPTSNPNLKSIIECPIEKA
jgi:hypothetical protein